MEIHIRPFKVTAGTGEYVAHLPTSPEFAMKKLLSGGLERIYQIARVFRNEPLSSTHLPEFTMLEWYRANDSLERIKDDCKELLSVISQNVHQSLVFESNEMTINLTEWKSTTTRELFIQYTDLDIAKLINFRDFSAAVIKNELFQTIPDSISNWDDLYFYVWLNHIEPKIDPTTPLFVTHYPESQAALAQIVTDDEGNQWADRFELYLGGYELANAFNELTDPDVQLNRFENDMNTRKSIYGDKFPPSPIDHELIRALREGLPKSAGIAVGVDRLVMLFSGVIDIRHTVWLEPYQT